MLKYSLLPFLKQPYPFYYSKRVIFLTSMLLFLMTLFFGYFFEPFDVYVPEHKMDYFWIACIHALTPVVVALFFSGLKITLKTEENWTVGKEIRLIALYLLAIGIVQFLIRDLIYDNDNNWSWYYLYEEIRNTFLVGMLFAMLIIPLNFNRLNLQNTKKAKVLNGTKTKLASKGVKENVVTIENYKLEIKDFVFAKAEGNYLEIHLRESSPSKIVMRITIKEFEVLLKTYINVIKTHRSYMVNSHYIENVKGNAQGYKLHLKNSTTIIPVSRTMVSHFNTQMKNQA